MALSHSEKSICILDAKYAEHVFRESELSHGMAFHSDDKFLSAHVYRQPACIVSISCSCSSVSSAYKLVAFCVVAKFFPCSICQELFYTLPFFMMLKIQLLNFSGAILIWCFILRLSFLLVRYCRSYFCGCSSCGCHSDASHDYYVCAMKQSRKP